MKDEEIKIEDARMIRGDELEFINKIGTGVVADLNGGGKALAIKLETSTVKEDENEYYFAIDEGSAAYLITKMIAFFGDNPEVMVPVIKWLEEQHREEL